MSAGKTRTITIVVRSDNEFDVMDGESVCDGLCWDEMLGTIAELTHPRIGQARYRMCDADHIVARMERAAQHRHAFEVRELAPEDLDRVGFSYRPALALDDPCTLCGQKQCGGHAAEAL